MPTYTDPQTGMILACHDDHIYRVMQRTQRLYEADLLAHIAALAPSGVSIDVGANIGTHTVFFAAVMGRQVVAFEPVPANAALLQRNVRVNGQEARVRVVMAALGEAYGAATIVLDLTNMGRCRLAPDAPGNPDAYVLPLDDLWATRAEPVGLIKIDCEGMERAVLRGATHTIARHRPHIFAEAASLQAVDALDHYLGGTHGYVRAPGHHGRTPVYQWSPT